MVVCFQTLVPQTYEKAKENLKRILVDVDAVACTTDLWSSTRTQASYPTVTAHFLVGADLKTAVLDTRAVPEQHTGPNIAAAIKENLEEYGVQYKISCFVTDNANNMKAAVRDLDYRHVSCMAHTINLLVKDALKASEGTITVIEKVKNIVTYSR